MSERDRARSRSPLREDTFHHSTEMTGSDSSSSCTASAMEKLARYRDGVSPLNYQQHHNSVGSHLTTAGSFYRDRTPLMYDPACSFERHQRDLSGLMRANMRPTTENFERTHQPYRNNAASPSHGAGGPWSSRDYFAPPTEGFGRTHRPLREETPPRYERHDPLRFCVPAREGFEFTPQPYRGGVYPPRYGHYGPMPPCSYLPPIMERSERTVRSYRDGIYRSNHDEQERDAPANTIAESDSQTRAISDPRGSTPGEDTTEANVTEETVTEESVTEDAVSPEPEVSARAELQGHLGLGLCSGPEHSGRGICC